MQPIIKIAFADDHSMYRKALVSFIENNTSDISCDIQTENGKRLLEELSRTTNLPDVCLLDINMPEMNGYETMAEISKHWPDLKVMAFSMHENEFAVISMLRRGAAGYALKYGNPADIVHAIKFMHENGFYHSDLIKGIPKKDDILPKISDKELDFLAYCCLDFTYQEIAKKMIVSTRTVEWYRDTLFKKLNIKTRSGLVLFAIKIGLAPGNELH